METLKNSSTYILRFPQFEISQNLLYRKERSRIISENENNRTNIMFISMFLKSRLLRFYITKFQRVKMRSTTITTQVLIMLIAMQKSHYLRAIVMSPKIWKAYVCFSQKPPIWKLKMNMDGHMHETENKHVPSCHKI